jgi:hypothetical protein
MVFQNPVEYQAGLTSKVLEVCRSGDGEIARRLRRSGTMLASGIQEDPQTNLAPFNFDQVQEGDDFGKIEYIINTKIRILFSNILIIKLCA